MFQAKLECQAKSLEQEGAQALHALIVMPLAKALPADLPGSMRFKEVLKRRDMKLADLAKTPLAIDQPGGGRYAYVMVDTAQARYTQLSVLRKAAMLLLEETPREIHAVVCGGDGQEALQLAREALYVLSLNGAVLPARKKKAAKPLKRIVLHGEFKSGDFTAVAALAAANILARELTALPPNELTPRHYRGRVRALAKTQGWRIEEYDFKRLKKLGAGAFCAVAQGSHEQDAAIVHLSYRPKGVEKNAPRVALVGKGICFDTGGHNLKPAKYMSGMHEDMNGSAVALALLLAVQTLRLPLAVDAWLAIAQNHISAQAYKQNDIVTALDGTHIEIVHTDAEGRLVLADSLTLAAKSKPDLMIDFATLTGSMVSALGNRYAGVFASSDTLAGLAVGAGRQSGERVCVFPMDEDYESALDSKVADIKQCTLEGEADHILAARFLKRFTQELPWLHVDLSSANCKGGLGAVASDITGFGVAWGVALLAQWLAAE
ncbi:MAG: leucyl aminopeptidase family protein [Proteobacteria bacterium]|nr:leucyl aminopeptidase family protein [Pseudomonadota bacterium]